MALGHRVDTDKVIEEALDHAVHKHAADRVDLHDVAYVSRYDVDLNIPRFDLPKEGVDARVAYQLLHDELSLDGLPQLNLASFVHTWVPPECTQLMMENLNKNLVDQDEYPAAQDIHERCVSMISGLWNAPKGAKPMGTATTGSSEAIMLGGLALKRRWEENRKKAGKSIHEPGPNIIMGANAQVALEKFARYFDVECRLVDVTVKGNYVMDPKDAIKLVDENTIGVFVILGSTYTGAFENVKEMADELDRYEEKTGHYVPIHVDGASGGFVAPFVYPDLEWDFRIPRVQSINASGHKYGMSAVGVGWIIWRSADFLPSRMIFELHYLGETDFSFNLNFSRPTHPILGQMFNFINLGYEGYRRIMSANLAKSRILSRALEDSGYFTIVSQIHLPQKGAESLSDDDPNKYLQGLPVVGFRFTDEVYKKYPEVKQMWLQNQLRQVSWIVPNYALPPSCDKTEILRVVIRESMSGDLLRKLIQDIINCTETLLYDGGSTLSSAQAAAHAKQASGSDAAPKRHGHTGLKSGNSNRDTARAHKKDALPHEDIKANHHSHSHVC